MQSENVTIAANVLPSTASGFNYSLDATRDSQHKALSANPPPHNSINPVCQIERLRNNDKVNRNDQGLTAPKHHFVKVP